eukprot:CAMPEP_0196140588 /NCGR_PEP_ID=MMETSP0910-20130528/7446_1 /TAXON_ID=49265 /ORGANISM="Thalassiosira rotula, Strain GSO102" /LENGTH=47 /DNA_ID= /DNA_START= /DNA_END= /DNA_ORIENTATION=
MELFLPGESWGEMSSEFSVVEDNVNEQQSSSTMSVPIDILPSTSFLV